MPLMNLQSFGVLVISKIVISWKSPSFSNENITCGKDAKWLWFQLLWEFIDTFMLTFFDKGKKLKKYLMKTKVHEMRRLVFKKNQPINNMKIELQLKNLFIPLWKLKHKCKWWKWCHSVCDRCKLLTFTAAFHGIRHFHIPMPT